MAIPTNAEIISSLPSDQKIAALLGGSRWELGTSEPENVQYKFPSQKDQFGDYSGGGGEKNSFRLEFIPSNSVLADDVRTALNQWSAVANIVFTEITSGVSKAISFGKAASFLEGRTAWAYPPYSDTDPNGDIWLSNYENKQKNIDYDAFWEAVGAGTYAHWVLLHEIGHAIGLKHPGTTSKVDGFTNTATLSRTGFVDYVGNTVMSYLTSESSSSKSSSETDTFLPKTGVFYPSSPMLLDIAAAQYLYGPNWKYNTGNNTYSFSDAAQFYQTIWDAGGIDEFDFSAANSPATIDLNNGAFSEIHKSGGTYRVAIAFARTDDPKDDPATPENEARNDTIENAKGGSGNDTIHGNDAANSLAGNAGNDDLFGEDGNDWLDGGSDLDRLYGGNGRDTIKGGPGNDEALGGDGNDWITMGDGNDWARGGAGNDTVDGGSGENKLYGDAGDDALVGQPTDDRLYGSYRHPDPRGDPRPDGDDVFKIVGDDIPPYVTGQNNTILYTFGHRLDRRDHYGNGDKIDLSELAGGGWKLIHSGDALKPGTIKVTNHDINLWKVDGYAVSQLVGKDKDGDYFQLFIDDGPANGWDYRVKDFIGVTSDFPDLA